MATAYVLINCELGSEEAIISQLKNLEGVIEVHGTFGAYDILETLRTEGLRSQPPVAYRALEFLVEHSFAHKIERLNAFVGCTYPEKGHSPVFMICRECNQVAETLSFPIIGTLSKTAKAIGFEIEEAVVETEGICPRCRKTEIL